MKENNTQTSSLRRRKKNIKGRRRADGIFVHVRNLIPLPPRFAGLNECTHTHTQIYIPMYTIRSVGGLHVSLMWKMTSAQDEKEDHPNIRLYSNFFLFSVLGSVLLCCLSYVYFKMGGEFKRRGGLPFSKAELL